MENGIVHFELIGSNLRVKDSRNKSAISLEGKVVDETRHMVVIETRDGMRKRLVKSQHLFEIDDKQVNGTELEGRPEERIKQWIRKKSG
jgi:RNase P/RNase MRP subunit p29